MSLCCTDIQILGCYDNCQDIDTKLTTLQAGDFIIREYWLDGINDQTVALGIGVNIIFPNIYNEYAEHTIKIYNPDGTVFTNSGNDCFTFQVNAKSS